MKIKHIQLHYSIIKSTYWKLQPDLNNAIALHKMMNVYIHTYKQKT